MNIPILKAFSVSLGILLLTACTEKMPVAPGLPEAPAVNSGAWGVKTDLTPPPKAPLDIYTTGQMSGQVTLVITNRFMSPDFLGFNILRSNTGNTNWVQINSGLVSRNDLFRWGYVLFDKNVIDGTTNKYRIQSLDSGLNYSTTNIIITSKAWINKGYITGVVIDRNGNPVLNALVIASFHGIAPPSFTDTTGTTTSDFSGSFVVPVESGVSYYIVATTANLVSTVRSVPVPAGGSVTGIILQVQ